MGPGGSTARGQGRAVVEKREARPHRTASVAEAVPTAADEDSGAEGSAESEDMKVAIAMDGPAVSEHFGHCAGYAVYSIENNSALRQEDLANPGHVPGFLPIYLAERGIGIVIAGGMGPRARDLLCENGIEVVVGVGGTVDEVARAFAAGALMGGECVCNHDHCSGDCDSH